MKFASRFDEFHEQAIVAAGGLRDFGAPDYHEGLKLLLADYDHHCHFSPLGELASAQGIVGGLTGRLLAQYGFTQHPAYADSPIEKPLIIVGMMRTGTTALHTMLTKDPDNQGLEHWLARAPMPRPPRDTWDANPWYQKSRQGLEQFYAVAPMKDAHPMYADQPDECLWALDQTFWSASQTMHATVPGYARWCLDADARYAYRYFRRLLGLVGGGSRKRWVLKTPCHIWGLDALLDVFPDACIVFTHRDILTSMTSTASVGYLTHHAIEPELTKAQIGRQLMMEWGHALDKAEKVRRKYAPSRFIDIHSRDLQSDPTGTIQKIYNYFDLPFCEAFNHALQHQIEIDPRAGHAVRQYKAEDFGLTEKEIIASVGAYHERLISITG